MNKVPDIIRAGDVGAILGPDWEGWSWYEGKIYAPEWRQGLGPGDIRALPYLNALAADYRRANRKYDTELARMQVEVDIAIKNEAFYRSQLRLEAKLGHLLERIAG